MATLSNKRKEQVRKKKFLFSLYYLLLGLAVLPYLTLFLQELLVKKFDYKEVHIKYFQSFGSVFYDEKQLQFFLLLYGSWVLFLFWILTNNMNKIGRTDTMMVTNKIRIPVAVGQGQHGTSRFMTEEEKKREYCFVEYDVRKALISNENLGLVLGMTKVGKKEKIICINEDVHTLILGSTRSGKTRREILESIWLRAKAGGSMIMFDPKGELYLYSYPFLKTLDYDIYVFDLNEPLKSMRYNFLIYIIKAVNENDIPQAIDKTWDLVSVLVGVPKGEPLWTDGNASCIAASILAVVIEADKKYQNLANVYEFIHHMCKVDECGDMPITEFFNNLPDVHPAKSVFGVAEISPDKMRGSFFGSALTTLRLFTNWNIADLTSESDFDVKDIALKKSALFIIIPDEKTTLYPIATLFIAQSYVALTEVAKTYGGRVPITVDYFWDEFGQCPHVPDLGAGLSVAAGRGIRFNLVLHSFQQLEGKYKEESETIKGNCLVWIYLKSPILKTLDELSKKTGTYTVQVNSNSSSSSNNKNSNYSDSANMQSRPLLYPDEVGRIETPYSLVFYAGKHPAIFLSPDLIEYKANEDFGLGDKEHNRKVILKRGNDRKERQGKVPELWGIWNEESDKINSDDNEKYSFLN